MKSFVVALLSPGMGKRRRKYFEARKLPFLNGERTSSYTQKREPFTGRDLKLSRAQKLSANDDTTAA